MRELSIIIPTRQFDAALCERLTARLHGFPDAEVIIVEPDDLGCLDARPDLPADWRLLSAQRGRGTQCNEGARAAQGELMMFLHDDTDLPADASSLIKNAFSDRQVGMTCFRLRFDRRHWLLRLYEQGSRLESLFTTFGDQALTVRRSVFEAIGGFPDWPLFEDVELARRVRRQSRIRKLPAAVTTSAARYQANGMLGQQLANGLLLTRFLLGTSPERLAAIYERRREHRQADKL